MKRTIILITFALSSTSGLMLAADQASITSKLELRTAIKTAKTPADRQRIAEYYNQRASEFRDKQREEERLAAHFTPNSARSKVPDAYASTMKLAAHFGDEADQAIRHAQTYEQLASAGAPLQTIASK